MSEKLHNEEFDVKRVDGSALSGDSNKIKLKITSYAVILEVQEAYMKEEIAAKEQDKKDLEQKLESEELSRKDKREIKKDLSLLNAELDILNDVFLEFSESRKRFMEIAKKALKLPEENLKELGETGWLEMESKKVNIDTEYENIQNKLIDAQDDENVFTSVDTDAIKEAVEKAMNEKSEDLPEEYKNDGDFIAENITSDNFDDAISSATENIKDVVDEKKTDELTEEDARDIFANAGTVASENPKIKEEENATPDFSLFGQEEIIPETHTIEFENPPIAVETSEWAAEPATEVEENTNTNNRTLINTANLNIKNDEEREIIENYIRSTLSELITSEQLDEIIKKVNKEEGGEGSMLRQTIIEMIEDGRKEGEKKGRKEGNESGISQVAINMLKQKYKKEEIKKCTGLSYAKIAKLEKSLQSV